VADDWDIDVERSGGFAGITRRANASTGELPEADATQLAVLASAVDFDRYAHQAPHTGRPDAFQYQLKVRHGAARREFVVGEHETDPALAALIAWVLGRAPAPRPPGS
jgi:hypothetical protein